MLPQSYDNFLLGETGLPRTHFYLVSHTPLDDRSHSLRQVLVLSRKVAFHHLNTSFELLTLKYPRKDEFLLVERKVLVVSHLPDVPSGQQVQDVLLSFCGKFEVLDELGGEALEFGLGNQIITVVLNEPVGLVINDCR